MFYFVLNGLMKRLKSTKITNIFIPEILLKLKSGLKMVITGMRV